MTWYQVAGLLFLILILGSFSSDAQGSEKDSLIFGQGLSEIVVTATRSSRKITDVPIPVTIVGKEQIQSSGASRLDEILSEQTGLAIVNDHGFGLQMQGLGSEYCLILINGEPVLGRTAGTLDLTRITLNNVKRIEIIKGPSSSLYGSDALGGVVNIITEDAEQTGIRLQTKYGSNNISDHTLTGMFNLKEKGSASLSVNRFHTSGYDLNPSSYGNTIDPYTDYTFRARLKYQFTPKLKLSVSGHYFMQDQKEDYLAEEGKDTIFIKGKGKETNSSINPVLSYQFSPDWKLKLHTYWSGYRGENTLDDSKMDSLYEHTVFNQHLWKEEVQSENVLSAHQVLTSGLGFTRETITSTRYPEKEVLTDYYLYLQHEWRPTAWWNILTGLRYDHPSAYHNQLSPKVAAQLKLNEHWSLQASVGSGYKAPDLRQLYLTFSNSVVGYTVLGAEAVEKELEKMNQNGLIERMYVQPNQAGQKLKPESSWAYNLGATYRGFGGWTLSANLFRNDIKDMIDTRVIAMKTNGQPLYSYHNIQSVFTQGLEVEAKIPLLENKLFFSAGYQYLIAKDKQAIADIKDGVFVRNPETQKVERLKLSDYGGLFNRSRHNVQAKLNYKYQTWSANLRLVYHSRYGFADQNNNDILDAENEYAPGYALVNLNMAKKFWSDQLEIRAGVKDLFNYTDPQHLSYVPGREWYVGATLELFKNRN